MPLYLKSLTHYTPPGRLTNADLEKMVDTNDEWIVTRTGISERAMAAPNEGPSDLALPAAKEAIAKAGLKAQDIDVVVVATCTPDTTMPGSSSWLQAAIGAKGAMAFDVNAACSGFVYAMDVVDGLLATGRYKNILLACAEKFSSMINYQDRGTCILFGDGAGVAVLSSEAKGPELKTVYCGGDGNLIDLLWRPAGGSRKPLHQHPNPDDAFVQMKGSEVFKHAVRGMTTSAEETLKRAGWEKDELNWLVPHQANRRLIQAAAERLHLPMEQVVVNIERYGNMSAASIPVAMSEAQHRFKKGDKIICLAFGAGFTWGGLAIEWN